jgi:hypothetical protein
MRNFVLSVPSDVFVDCFTKLLDDFFICHLPIGVFSEGHASLFPLLFLDIFVNGHQYLHFAEALQSEVDVHNLIVVLRFRQFIMVTDLFFGFDHFFQMIPKPRLQLIKRIEILIVG